MTDYTTEDFERDVDFMVWACTATSHMIDAKGQGQRIIAAYRALQQENEELEGIIEFNLQEWRVDHDRLQRENERLREAIPDGWEIDLAHRLELDRDRWKAKAEWLAGNCADAVRGYLNPHDRKGTEGWLQAADEAVGK